MPNSTKNLVPFHLAKEELLHLSTSSFVDFCVTPERRWDERAREALATVMKSRTDSAAALAAAFPSEGDGERLSDLAIFFAAELGSETPPCVIERIDFDDAYRAPALKGAFYRFLSRLNSERVHELRMLRPKQRIALFRFAHDEDVFRGLLRDKDWKGYVGEAGPEALPSICASLAEDNHVAKRRQQAIASVFSILAEKKGALDEQERVAFEMTSKAWRELLEETSMVLEMSVNATDVLGRLDADVAAAWADEWVEGRRTDLSAQVALFAFLSAPFQWETIEAVAGKKRRATEVGRLRTEILKLPEPFRHVADLAKEHQAVPGVMKLLSAEVFSHRRHRAKFDEQMKDSAGSS